MAELTGPLFSLTASGTIGSALTYSRWRGVKYVRTRVVPANPHTAAQIAVRDVFRTLASIQATMTALGIAPWDAYAAGKPLTGRNAHTEWNLPSLVGDATMDDYRFARAMPGTLPPTVISPVGGVGLITVTITAPTPPAGWTIQAAIAGAVEEGDPSPSFAPLQGYTEDLTAPYVPVIVVPAGTYRVGAWLRYILPDLTIRYSSSLENVGDIVAT